MALVQNWSNSDYDLNSLAAAAVYLARAEERSRPIDNIKTVREEAPRRRDVRDTRPSSSGSSERRSSNGYEKSENPRRPEIRTGHETGMIRLVLDRGHVHGIRPRDIVGAIAAEAGIPGKAIGAIDIQNEQTYVDVKAAHVEQVLRQMRQWRMRGKPVKLTRAERAV
jgi:ATP-dependent RNA helicase DeaD